MDPLLSIKLATPRPSLPPISRPRVVQLLSGALQARLVLLSAPPGFGKTTALIDWLAVSRIEHQWVSLDQTDNDPVRLLRCMQAGVAKLVAADASPIAAPAAVDPLEAAGQLAARLAERPEPSVLVLDDYHLINAPSAQRVVGLLLERLPAEAHLVIATRADPRLPLARLRARGELLEVRADALRFTLEEARSFFAERMGLVLSEPDLETLVARTEGWPAVLQLAGLSLAGRPDITSRVRDFAATNRFVLDYVVEEVLAGLPPDTQDFLLRTSILERLSGPLCDAVTGERAGQARLEELERANLLILPLDDERRWYRYHALLAEILRARLAALHADEVAELHARASAWHQQHRDDEQAIVHGMRSGDLERTSEILAEASLRHLNAGELSTVRRWLDALPPDVVRGHPQLSASYAWCLTLAGETEGVAERLTDAERALATGRDGGPFAGPMLPTELALLRARLATLRGDTATAIAHAHLARSLVPPGLPAESEATLRGDASVLLANALLRAGDAEAAAEAYAESLPDLRAGGNMFALGRAIADLASIAINRGDAAGAVLLCQAELERSPDERPATTSPALWAAMAKARAELGQADLADIAARRALELATRAGDAPSARSAHSTLARIEPLLARRTAEPRPDLLAGPGGVVEALSAREVEVLRLAAVGRSNSQIAAELFVTVGTVKSHLHTISGKLGAANRVEAVARGRELGLLR
jgi:LuxR family transcriptional regulator, maltose regulon positive regulatory protein